MIKSILYTTLAVLLVKVTLAESFQFENADDGPFEIHNKSRSGKSLSRKKRYLVFPEGSNLQLVYCLTMPSLGMGKIFTIGATAAVAWELPHNPLAPFRRPSELLHRNDEGPIKYSNTKKKFTSDDSWTVVNPKRPLSNSQNYVSSNKRTMYDPFLLDKSRNSWEVTPINDYNGYYPWREQKGQLRRNGGGGNRVPYEIYEEDEESYHQPVTTYANPIYHQIHRRTRRDLYGKFTKLLTALSRDGKACLLKAVCEVSQASRRKGTFMEEIIKAVFRVKPHDNYKDEDEYDLAANKNHNCTDQYPTCVHSVWSNMFF